VTIQAPSRCFAHTTAGSAPKSKPGTAKAVRPTGLVARTAGESACDKPDSSSQLLAKPWRTAATFQLMHLLRSGVVTKEKKKWRAIARSIPRLPRSRC
jgi:hypothetical protein